MHRVGTPDPAQLARPQQPGQGDGVAPVGLDVIARAPRDQGGGDDLTAVAKGHDGAREPGAGRPSLVAEVQPRIFALQLAPKALHGGWRRFDLADIADLAASSAFSDGDRMLGFGGFDTDVDDAILPHGPPSLAWGSARHTRATPASSSRKGYGRAAAHTTVIRASATRTRAHSRALELDLR
jgi:hypothetical protein